MHESRLKECFLKDNLPTQGLEENIMAMRRETKQILPIQTELTSSPKKRTSLWQSIEKCSSTKNSNLNSKPMHVSCTPRCDSLG
jgi:hypothetical protein